MHSLITDMISTRLFKLVEKRQIIFVLNNNLIHIYFLTYPMNNCQSQTVVRFVSE